jgi:NADP-dependent 3-hydroxy acid dehydrogenase YdfG
MNTIKSKTILITGASKGIGKAVAMAFAPLQVTIGLIARSAAELQEVQQLVIAAGSPCEIYCGNVADEAFVNSTVQSFAAKFGHIDILINNAGFGIFKKVQDTSSEDWDSVFATNTKGTFLFCKAVIPFMKEKNSGLIINVASDVAKRVFDGGSLYCASKYAQDAFSMALRKELRPSGIKVSVVYSGLVDSYFHAEPQGASSHDNWLKNEDMANAIIYIATQPKHVVIDELMIHPLEQEY